MDWRDLSCSSGRVVCIDPADKLFCLTASLGSYTCDDYNRCYECPRLEADPDIAGIGVISAFIINAGLSLIASITYLLIQPRTDEEHAINQLDKLLRFGIAKPIQKRLGPTRCKLYSECLLNSVLSLSDQQLVLGLATMSTAIYLYRHTRITVYHFTIAIDLAWLSSNTHLLSLLVLRDYLSKSGKEKRKREIELNGESSSNDFDEGFQGMKIWRVLCMIALAAMLLFGTIISGYVDWGDHGTCPANCLPKSEFGGTPLKWMIVNIIMIAWGYTAYTIMIFGSLRRRLLEIRKGIEAFHKHRLDSLSGRLLAWPYWILAGVFRVIWGFMASVALDVVLQILWFIWGTYFVLVDRKWGHRLMGQWSADEAEGENQLGFGQLVPLLLLALPFMAMSEAYHAARKEAKK